MAGAAGATHVECVEMHAALAATCAATLRANRVRSWRVWNRISTQLRVGDASELRTAGEGAGSARPLQPADVCVSEVLDSGCIGEGVLHSLRHATRHLLRPGAVVLPRCDPPPPAGVASRHPCTRPAVAEASARALAPPWQRGRGVRDAGRAAAAQPDGGRDVSGARRGEPPFALHPPGEHPQSLAQTNPSPDASCAPPLGRQLREGYAALRLHTVPHARLSAAAPAMRFDFAALPDEVGGIARRTLRATRAGRCNAVAWWFDLDLDGAGTVLSAAPGSGVRTWKQNVCYLPAALDLRPGHEVDVVVWNHDDDQLHVWAGSPGAQPCWGRFDVATVSS